MKPLALCNNHKEVRRISHRAIVINMSSVAQGAGGRVSLFICCILVSPLRLLPTYVEGRTRFCAGAFVKVCILCTRVGPWLAPVPGTACLACCSSSASSSKVFCFGTAEATQYCVTGKSEKLRAQQLFVGNKGAAGCGGLVQNKERHRLWLAGNNREGEVGAIPKDDESKSKPVAPEYLGGRRW